MIIVHVLYILKSSGEAWRSMLVQNLHGRGYQSIHADPDAWINMITIPDGEVYYTLILIYIDDILHIYYDTNSFMNNIREIYRLNGGFG